VSEDRGGGRREGSLTRGGSIESPVRCISPAQKHLANLSSCQLQHKVQRTAYPAPLVVPITNVLLIAGSKGQRGNCKVAGLVPCFPLHSLGSMHLHRTHRYVSSTNPIPSLPASSSVTYSTFTPRPPHPTIPSLAPHSHLQFQSPSPHSPTVLLALVRRSAIEAALHIPSSLLYLPTRPVRRPRPRPGSSQCSTGRPH